MAEEDDPEDVNHTLDLLLKNLEFAEKLYSDCKQKECNDCTKIYLPNIVEFNRKIGEIFFKLSLVDQGIQFFSESLKWISKRKTKVKDHFGKDNILFKIKFTKTNNYTLC